MLELWAGLITLAATTVLTIAGVGAAFILVPVFLYLGIEIHTAMSTALLLNGVSMLFASITFAREKLILWRLAFPILVIASMLAPIGAYVGQYVPRSTLLLLFVLFLLFAATMMLFYKPANATAKSQTAESDFRHVVSLGLPLGGIAGFVGGLLGVGGGNIIVPALIWQGIPPKRASATTSLIVMFSSFAGFAGHVSVGSLNYSLLSYTTVGSIGGALIGARLMSRKLQNKHVKALIGVLLYAVAGKLLFDLWY